MYCRNPCQKYFMPRLQNADTVLVMMTYFSTYDWSSFLTSVQNSTIMLYKYAETPDSIGNAHQQDSPVHRYNLVHTIHSQGHTVTADSHATHYCEPVSMVSTRWKWSCRRLRGFADDPFVTLSSNVQLFSKLILLFLSWLRAYVQEEDSFYWELVRHSC